MDVDVNLQKNIYINLLSFVGFTGKPLRHFQHNEALDDITTQIVKKITKK